MELVLLCIITIIVVAWIILFTLQYDHLVPIRSLEKYKKVMVVFPHPDDESLSCGGTIRELVDSGCQVTLAVFTKGERGVEGAALTPQLKPIRTKEMEMSARYLGITNLIQLDLGDGQLDTKKHQIQTTLAHLLETEQPDLVITYDLSGLYGHSDHIAVSEVVTKLINSHYPSSSLWYISRSKKMYKRMKLPTHMAKDQNFLKFRQLPTFQIRLGLASIWAKIMSLQSHKSQHFAFKKSRPKFIPLWFIVSTQTNEYFYLAHQGEK